MDPFHLLADEVVVKILSFVTLGDLSNRTSLVSTRFRRLSLDPSLWKNLYIMYHEDIDEDIDEEDLEPLGVDAGRFLFKPWGTEAALGLVDRCSQLRTLTVVDRGNADDLVCRALERNSDFGQLKEIQLQIFEDRNVNADKILEAIGLHGKALRILRLYGCVEMDLSGTMSRNPGCLQNLTALVIRNYSKYALSDVDLMAVADSCKNLSFFSFENSGRNTDKALDYLLQGLSKTLEGFRMPANVYGSLYTDEAFKNISQCGRLTWMSIHFDRCFSGKTLDAILEIPLLRTLIMVVSCRSNFSIAALSVQDYVMAFGKTREKLEHLELFDSELKDRSLTAIADGCPNLISLSINGYLKITDQSISRVLEKCGRLRYLELTRVERMTSKSFEKIRAPLERLAFGNCCCTYDGKKRAPPLSLEEEEKIKSMMPRLEISQEIRNYSGESWWEGCVWTR